MPLGIVNEENISDSTRPDQGPAGMRLALDVGGSGIVLSIQRIELLVESIFRGDAGVDGTADGPDRRSLHDRKRGKNAVALASAVFRSRRSASRSLRLIAARLPAFEIGGGSISADNFSLAARGSFAGFLAIAIICRNLFPGCCLSASSS